MEQRIAAFGRADTRRNGPWLGDRPRRRWSSITGGTGATSRMPAGRRSTAGRSTVQPLLKKFELALKRADATEP